MKMHLVQFPGTRFAPLEVPARAPLSLHLSPLNSPVLFGCREGQCGTCMCRVQVVAGELEGPAFDEIEALEVYGDGQDDIRLACQIVLTADIEIRKP